MTEHSSRPRRLVVIAGTATEIGKTWVAAAVLRAALDAGWTVAARKPAQSTVPGEVADSEILAMVTGESADAICRPERSYSVPMAPPMAAEATGQEPPTLDQLADELQRSWVGRFRDLGVVELAGGVASPMSLDGDGSDLVGSVEPDAVVLVADAGLGTINAVRLAVASLRTRVGPSLAIHVFLNRFDEADELHRRNRDWLVEREALSVTVSVETLLELLLSLDSGWCASCGRPAGECPGDCVRPLDPDRFCERCGRRLVVSISPTGHSSRCKVHG